MKKTVRNQFSISDAPEVFRIFREICAIPHGSGHTEELSRYCMKTAQDIGLWYRQDTTGNVLIRRPADPGFESIPPVVLQAHLDMVCIRTDSCENPDSFPVQLRQDEDILMAESSTLGADNGIGIAYIMALLTQEDGSFPMLEGLLTVDEETTMGGANAFDVSWLKSRRMINLDSEEEGIILAGSAGGIALDCTTVPETIHRIFAKGVVAQLTLSGLEGGHSGLDIHKGRGNAVRALAGLLLQAAGRLNYLLCSFSGGRFPNAIPDEACCSLVLEEDHIPFLREYGVSLEEELRKKLNRPEIQLSWSVSPLKENTAEGFAPDWALRCLRFITGIPDGVQRMDSDIPDTTILSTNLGTLQLGRESCRICFALRANEESGKETLLNHMVHMAGEYGFTPCVHDGYPCWEYRSHSPLRECACRVYEEMTGQTPVTTVIHAGAECGIFCAQLPDMDCISIGPDIQNAHTIYEKTSVSSVVHVWKFLRQLLQETALMEK